jgi:hypothetical protein
VAAVGANIGGANTSGSAPGQPSEGDGHFIVPIVPNVPRLVISPTCVGTVPERFVRLIVPTV